VPERRASRFALEVLFLVALAVGLTIANQPPLVIAGVMALGWVLVALGEWAAWRGEPHYGSGLPPRYYIPQVSLPPRQALEQFGDGYPAGRDEAPTWIASPSLRAEVLGEWPVAAPVPGEETEEAPADAEVTDEHEAEAEAEPADTEADAEAVEVEEVATDEPVARRRRLWGRREEGDDGADPWAVAELPVEPDADRPAPGAVAVATRTARHRIDPLDEPEPKRRRWQRRPESNGAYAEVPARPDGVRALPGSSKRED
jgi:hypothetical protein